MRKAARSLARTAFYSPASLAHSHSPRRSVRSGYHRATDCKRTVAQPRSSVGVVGLSTGADLWSIVTGQRRSGSHACHCMPTVALCGFFRRMCCTTRGQVAGFQLSWWVFDFSTPVHIFPQKKKKTPVHIYIVNQETNFPIMHACHSIFICSKYIEPLLHAKKTGSGNNKRNYYAYASWCPNFV